MLSNTNPGGGFGGFGADVLERVLYITGVEIKELMKAKRGPRANPARRFGVWALRNATQMTQTEIGEILGMSTSQVANVLRRINVKDEPIRTWIAKW